MSSRLTKHNSTVVLVGRPNVGKSTLFNRLTGSRRAIVTRVPGTTRDVLVAQAEWQGTCFTLADTGGLFGASEDPLYKEVASRGRRALKLANLIVFVVDGREGLVPADEEIAKVIRTSGVTAFLAVNKTDYRQSKDQVFEFSQFGFESVVEISAEHGLGIGDLLDQIVCRLPVGRAQEKISNTKHEVASKNEVGVAIVGRPNVGKSSLVNRLVRRERVMVSERPGTTRDAIDEVITWYGRQFRIVDTAGIRRAGRVARAGRVEAVSVVVARRAIERADVVVLVVDAILGPIAQDATIAGEAQTAGCGLVIAINKWDLVKASSLNYASDFDERLRRKLKFADYAPVIHTSALTGERTPKLLEAIDKVAKSRRKRVSTGELNRLITAITESKRPARVRGRSVRILYATQIGIEPPTFVFFTNVVRKFHFSYERFIINRLRETFEFFGTPIRLHVRARNS